MSGRLMFVGLGYAGVWSQAIFGADRAPYLIGELKSGEPVIVIGECKNPKNSIPHSHGWPDLRQVITRFGIGWVNAWNIQAEDPKGVQR